MSAAREVPREAKSIIEQLLIGAALAALLFVGERAFAQEKSALAKLLAEPSALKFNAAAGQCRYGRSPDGMWWQSDQENHSIYKDNCGEIGMAWKINPLFGVSLRYVTLGRAHTRALARTFPEDDAKNRRNVDARRPECAAAFNGDNCLYQWSGDGGIEPGFNLAIDMQLGKAGPFRFEGEVGALLYRLRWNEQVYSLGCQDGGCPWRVTVDQRSDYLLSPMAGLTMRLGHFFVATRYYLRTSQHTPVSAGISGPMQTWLIGIETNF